MALANISNVLPGNILSNFTLDLKVATGKDPPFGYYERVNCGVYQRKQKRKGDI